MRRARSGFTILLLPLLLPACSTISGWFSNEEESLKPAELVDFVEEIKVRRLWSTSLGNGQGKKYQRLVPAVVDERIYVAASNGEVAAFDIANGKREWRSDVDEELSGGVGIGAGLALVGTSAGQLVALEQSSGVERWRRQLSSEVLAAPAASGEVVVAQTFDGTLYGLAVGDGTVLWRHETSLPVLTLRGTAAPIVSGEEVFAAFANGKLLALETSTGTLRWETRVAAPQGQSEIERIVDIDGTPLLMDSDLYAVSYQGRLGSFSRVSGRPNWMADASSFERVAEGLGNIYVSDAGGKVAAHDINTGLTVWQQEQLLRRELSAPVAFRSWVAVADLEGYVHILSQHDGHFMGRLRADSKGVRAEMQARGDVLYIYGNSGSLRAYQVSPK